MSDKPQIKLAETVVLIDAAFLNFVITDIKGYFEETLHRSLQEIDLFDVDHLYNLGCRDYRREERGAISFCV